MARRLAQRMARDVRAVRLQAWWRGCLGRAKADRLWFNKKVCSCEGRRA
jgi:hypothetical protein